MEHDQKNSQGEHPSQRQWLIEHAFVMLPAVCGIPVASLSVEMNSSVSEIFYICMWYILLCNIFKK